MTGNPDNPQSPTNSVEDVEEVPKPPVRWLLGLSEQDSVSVKCTECDQVTSHQHYRLKPDPTTDNYPPEATDIEYLGKHTKRILMCTFCAKLSLKN